LANEDTASISSTLEIKRTDGLHLDIIGKALNLNKFSFFSK